ncbi:YraN family protein [Halanaerobium praevalens]|uniref:UPF0102 protein Hprae_0928 n=1 Tax=Halanaerobium praevalens (strain ATCC 33744 / DSM 2228 / GSL) TaxID=572479 RepID=E3DRP1_HALPG|nr:YraN family protein [Halanaerobium praevalens]ADO77082.1 Uncharacterized protein family UPF0102 [Halanaerobium praevalens DSM 2228]
MALHNKLGQLGEDIAVKYLIKENYHIIQRNYRNKFGEIDIIASKNNYTIFIEVKSRSSENYIALAHSLHAKQIAHLKRAAIFYFAEKNIHLASIRFDLITIKINPDFKKIDKLKHYKNIIN